MCSVAFSPDGKTIVSGSDDKTLKVWDAGVLAQPRHCHPPTLSPYLSPYLLLAAASLELEAEKQSAHSDGVCSVAFSPDGKTILSGSLDEAIKLWDAGFLVRGYR